MRRGGGAGRAEAATAAAADVEAADGQTSAGQEEGADDVAEVVVAEVENRRRHQAGAHSCRLCDRACVCVLGREGVERFCRCFWFRWPKGVCVW